VADAKYKPQRDTLLASTVLNFSINKSWPEDREQYRHKGKAYDGGDEH
jgi:hypothetical protein